ncbi:hypothetical protein [Candidatus Finniella inopinata]|uniref:DUF2232 domain-containing protein n=1 Tax=Candidatus Finniella inopinata TaxID=1696036 RepID=A0A4Q7DIV2_9PROT|nr:hypothetical protein [Candidatus Finniella inopinata]RZI46045.1 hypothetical protein EQU50_03685 [Candidatus Finniella inopinata]
MITSFFNLPPLLQTTLAGLVSALWAVIIPQIPVIGLILSPFLLVPLFFVSFSLGLKSGLQAGLSAVFFAFLISSPLAGYAFFILHFMPFMAISALFLYQKNDHWTHAPGMILSKMTMTFLLLVLGGLALLNAQEIDWQQSILRHLDQMTTASPSLSPMIEQMVGWLPSLVGLSMMASLTANVYTAQTLLKKVHRNLRHFQGEAWQVPTYWDIMVVVSMMAWMLFKFLCLPQTLLMAKTAALLSCVPLGFTGFRICYLRLSALASGRLWFRVLCMACFLLVWPLVFIVLLGFIEPWYALTQRFSQNQRNTHHNDD